MFVSDSDETILENFKANLESAMKAQRMSRSELSLKSGFKNRNKVTTILNGQSLPSMSVPIRLANALGIPVEQLFQKQNTHLEQNIDVLPVQEVDRQAARLLSAVFKAAERSLDRMSNRPTLDAMIAWWKETSGSLSQCDRVSPHFDLVQAAAELSEVPKIRHVGALGLSATTLGSNDNARLERFLETLNQIDIVELNKHIKRVSHSGVGMISPQTRIVSLPATGETVEISFVRLMLPVTDVSGNPYVLNYSTLVSESTPSNEVG